MEKEMRQSPVYKILTFLDEVEHEHKSWKETSHSLAILQVVSDIWELIRTEAPEVFELYTKDNPKLPEIPATTEETYNCPGCGVLTNYRGTGVCSTCESKGLWVDPAGGVHTEEDDDDPAAMYE